MSLWPSSWRPHSRLVNRPSLQLRPLKHGVSLSSRPKTWQSSISLYNPLRSSFPLSMFMLVRTKRRPLNARQLNKRPMKCWAAHPPPTAVTETIWMCQAPHPSRPNQTATAAFVISWPQTVPCWMVRVWRTRVTEPPALTTPRCPQATLVSSGKSLKTAASGTWTNIHSSRWKASQ